MAVFDPTPYSTHFVNGSTILEATRANTDIALMFHIFQVGAKIYGARLYTAKVGAHTVRLKLWRPQDTTGTGPVRSQDFQLVGPATYVLYFNEPYEATYLDMQSEVYPTSWMIGMYDPDNVNHTVNTGTTVPRTGRLTCGSYGYSNQQNTYYYNAGGGEGRPAIAYGRAVPLDPLVLPAVSTYEPTPWVDSYGANRVGVQSVAGNFTCGGIFTPMTFGRLHGIRCYTHIAGAHTLKGSIWSPTPAVVASKTLAVAGPGYYDLMFAAPYDITEPQLQAGTPDWYVGVYETTGTNYTIVQPSVRGWAARQFSWRTLKKVYSGNMQRYAAGDARPINLIPGNADVPVAVLVETL